MIDRRLFALPNIFKTLFGLVVLTGLQAFAILLQAIFLSKAIVGLWQGLAFNMVMNSVVIFAIAYIVRYLIVVLKNRYMAHFADVAAEKYRVQLLKKYTDLGPNIIAQSGTGSAVTMLGSGLDNVKNYFQLLLIKVFDLSIIPWVVLLCIFYLKWDEGVFLLLIFPVVILFFIILGLAAQSKADAEFANFKNLNNRFVDALRGLPTLKQLGLADEYSDEIYNISEDYRKATMRTLRIAITSTFALDFFTTLSIAIVAVFLGLDLLNGHMQFEPALIILVLSPEYFLPLRNFADDYHATLDGKNALTDVLDILDTPGIVQQQQLTLTQWSAQDVLTISDLQLTYPKQETATLKAITLSASGYQKIAIVGESGSGKSTLLNVLSGFLEPDSGRIEIDHQPLTQLAQQDWQRQFFYMPQQPYIFHTTLRENIAFYTPKANREDIKKAAQRAGLADLIQALPEGLDTVIGESGRQLSGGQAQRVALARMLLDTSRRILLFDEPTAHLDIETEIDLKKTMKMVLDNHLVFFATHRLHWLNQMDYVLVMNQGKIVESGEPQVLLAQDNSQLNQLRYQLRDGGLTHA